MLRDRCNPAPKDGSQPDLVTLDELPDGGGARLVRQSNTETAEQLNSWLKGFRTALGKMTDYNHDFFLYCILFLYSRDWERKRADEKALKERRERGERLARRREEREAMGNEEADMASEFSTDSESDEASEPESEEGEE